MSQCFNSQLPMGPPGPTGPVGPQGPIGSVWRSGNGTPLDSLGNNGDFYLDLLTGDIYQKISGSYQPQINITGAAGAASTVPGPAGTPGTNGNTILNDSGAPTTQGNDGDFYIDITTNEIYGPKTSGVWGAGTPLIGPQGPSLPSINLVDRRYISSVGPITSSTSFNVFSGITLPISNDLLFPTDKSSVKFTGSLRFKGISVLKFISSFDLDFNINGTQVQPPAPFNPSYTSYNNDLLIRSITVDVTNEVGHLNYEILITRIGGNNYTVNFKWITAYPTINKSNYFTDTSNPGALSFTSSDYLTFDVYGYFFISSGTPAFYINNATMLVETITN